MKNYLKVRELKIPGNKKELVARVFYAMENNVKLLLKQRKIERKNMKRHGEYMFYPTQLGSTDLNDYKDSKAYSYYKSGWFQPLYFHKLSGIKYCIFKKEKCRPSQIISQINHKLRIIMEKSG